jgi:hypothetical protein
MKFATVKELRQDLKRSSSGERPLGMRSSWPIGRGARVGWS